MIVLLMCTITCMQIIIQCHDVNLYVHGFCKSVNKR